MHHKLVYLYEERSKTYRVSLNMSFWCKLLSFIKQMSFAKVDDVEKLRGLPIQAQGLYMWLSKYANKEGTCFPSIKTLAVDCGMKERQIKRWIAFLKEKQLIKVEARFKENKQTTNIYRISRGVIEDTLPHVREDTQNYTTKELDQLTNITTIPFEIDASCFSFIIQALFNANTDREYEDAFAGKDYGRSPKQLACAIFGNKPFNDIWNLFCIHQTLEKRGIFLPKDKRAIDRIDITQYAEDGFDWINEIEDIDEFEELANCGSIALKNSI